MTQDIRRKEPTDRLANLRDLARTLNNAALEVERLADDLGMSNVALAQCNKTAEEQRIKLDSLGIEVAKHLRTIERLYDEKNRLQGMVDVMTPSVKRYVKLRLCDASKLPVTNSGILKGGDALDKALDEMP
jgi:chromosome segregation ATPase